MAANQTSNGPLVGLTAEPDGRGTWGILAPCLAVLFLNTWTVFHVNVADRTSTPQRRLLHRIKITVITFIVPDAIAAAAFRQWRLAKKSSRDLRPALPWWTIKHGFYAEMGGFRVYDSKLQQEYSFRTDEIRWLVLNNVVDIPYISEEELDDKSDADWVAKSIACAQSFWFLVQALARIAQKLPLTTVELEVIPFILPTWLTYFFWWFKPLNVTVPTMVYVDHIHPTVLDLLARDVCRPEQQLAWWRPATREVHQWGLDFYWFEKPFDPKTWRAESTAHRIPPHLRMVVGGTLAESKVAEWYRPSVNESYAAEWDLVDDMGIFALGIFINVLLLAAWDFSFPTTTESVIWKLATFIMLSVIIVWWPISWILSFWFGPETMVKHVPYYILVFLYAAGRIYVIVQPFFGVRALPAAAYQTVDWSQYMPHII